MEEDEANADMANGLEEGEEAAAADSLAERRKHSLAHKRSFLVRMVSDPKCYNPKIVRTLSTSRRRLSEDLKRDLNLKVDLSQVSVDESDDDKTPIMLSETGIVSPV